MTKVAVWLSSGDGPPHTGMSVNVVTECWFSLGAELHWALYMRELIPVMAVLPS